MDGYKILKRLRGIYVQMKEHPEFRFSNELAVKNLIDEMQKDDEQKEVA